ncbi:MAG TPA: DNA repair protein RecO [Polyangia bacterium]|nr:DNA repair protein RecO [Polyangia bacterium]
MATAITTDAILLRSVAYGESDRVVTLLGRTTGRVSALARGARKSVKRFGGGLGLGASGEALLRDRGGELMGLDGFEVREARLGLALDVARAAHASYGIELCDRLCGPRHPEPAVFDWLEEFLVRVEGGGARLERLRVFELGLLGRLGFGASFDCVACGRSEDQLGDESTRWHPERGGVVCRGCVRSGAVLMAETRRALARLGGLTLEAADAVTLDRDLNAGCRQAIRELLAFHIPGPLKSLEFIEKMSKGA